MKFSFQTFSFLVCLGFFTGLIAKADRNTVKLPACSSKQTVMCAEMIHKNHLGCEAKFDGKNFEKKGSQNNCVDADSVRTEICKLHKKSTKAVRVTCHEASH